MSKTEESFYILRKIVIDGCLLCVLVLALCGQEYLWKPFQRGFFCGDESLMYPYRPDTVTIAVLRILQVIPLVFFFVIEWVHLRRETSGQRCLGIPIPRWLQGFYCTAMCYGFGTCFNELIVNLTKIVIGRPRPHFFDVCRPSINCSLSENWGRYIQPTDYTCTANSDNAEMLKNANLSFLSGHTATAAFSMVYLALYLERRITWKGTRLLRHTLQFALIFTSVYVALSRVSDNKHHWSDVLAGFALGVIGAVVMFCHGTDFIKKDKSNEYSAQAQMDVTLVSHQQMALS